VKQHIIHITKITGIHGTEKHLLSLLPELTDTYQVTIALMVEPGALFSEYTERMKAAGVNVVPCVIRCNIDPYCFMDLLRLLKKTQPALVHTHLIHGDLYGITAAWIAGIQAVVSTKHNDDRFRRIVPITILNRLLNKRLRAAIAISDWVRNFTVSVEKIPEQSIETIYYGLAPAQPLSHDTAVREELGFSSDAVVLGIIARLIKQKGISTLLEAFAEAFAQNDRLRLIVAGEGELRPALERIVRKKKLDPAVRFLGYRNDVAAVLASLDIFVHPSLWEGFGLAILEAMAAGKPVIATNVSAIPELVLDGYTGILVPPEDPAKLSRAITTLSRNVALRQRYGENGRRRWQEYFTHAGMVAKTKRLYAALLETQRFDTA